MLFKLTNQSNASKKLYSIRKMELCILYPILYGAFSIVAPFQCGRYRRHWRLDTDRTRVTNIKKVACFSLFIIRDSLSPRSCLGICHFGRFRVCPLGPRLQPGLMPSHISISYCRQGPTRPRTLLTATSNQDKKILPSFFLFTHFDKITLCTSFTIFVRSWHIKIIWWANSEKQLRF